MKTHNDVQGKHLKHLDTNSAAMEGLCSLPYEKSPLLRLPFDLRRMIYELVLEPRIVRRGFFSISMATAFLRVCRQVFAETQQFLPTIGDTRLHFFSTTIMIDYLMRLDIEHIRKIRHIRVKGFPIAFYAPNMASLTFYYMDNILAMFPGLQLECLVVEDCFIQTEQYSPRGPQSAHRVIESLMRSKGWKEAHYISPTTRFVRSMTWSAIDPEKPDDWETILKVTDGAASESEVSMYVAITDNEIGMAENPDTRTTYSTASGQLEDMSEAYTRLTASPEKGLHSVEERECIVIAKRGDIDSLLQSGENIAEGLKEISSHSQWKELREGMRYYDIEDSLRTFVLSSVMQAERLAYFSY